VAVGHTILASFDPVAFDAVGLQMVVDALIADERESMVSATTASAEPWLAVGAELGLGTNDLGNVDLVEIELG
jgi:hypothetical protein